MLQEVSFYGSDVDFDSLYDVVDRLRECCDPSDAAKDIFLFIESAYDKDLGSPGPLVHYLEEGRYEDELRASLRRKPTDLTVCTVNRILNSLDGEAARSWIKELRAVLDHPEADVGAKLSAKEFIGFQRY